MHIGLCSPCWPPSAAANGIVSYASTVRDYFLSRGHNVSVIAGGRVFDAQGRAHAILPAGRDRSIDAWMTRIARRTDRWRGGFPGVGRLVASQIVAANRITPIDVVEMEESFGWCEAVRQRAGIPIVTRLHGPHFLKPARPTTRTELRRDRQRCSAEGRALRRARSLTAPTRAVLNATRQQYGIASTALSAVIPNPISLVPQSDRWALERCDPNHILMVGRFDFWKGADTMLAAFAHLFAWRPRARLTLVGPDMGIEVAPGRLASFDEYARALLPPGVADRVTFTGTLQPAQISRLRTDAYVTVLASRVENFPYALLEGLSTGCPMISTAWPGSEEIIEDGVSGLLTPIGEAASLARSLDLLMADPERACRLGRGGFEKCREKFSVEAVGAEMLRHYEATLEANGR